MKHVIRPAARRDVLLQFEHYLKENASDVAARFLQAVEKAVEQLLEMPGMGAPKPLKNSSLTGLRSWPVSGFEEIRVARHKTALNR